MYTAYVGQPFGDNVTSVDLGFGSQSFLRGPFTFADDCTCHSWYNSYGTDGENRAEQGVSYFIFTITCLNLLYYLINIFRATAGWEEIFVCIIEAFAAAISAWPQLSNPYTVYLSTGQRVQWIRYFEWLMTCPVILIHLSNLTGLKHHYPLRAMMLIVSDISCIVTGVTCALSNGYAKIIWFLISCTFGLITYFSAYKVYKEAHQVVPDPTSKRIVLAMAIIFFIAWTGYPLLFALGPEGFQQISYYAMNIGYSLNDMFSKNIWGLLGHTLRIRAMHNSREGWVVPRTMSGNSLVGSGKHGDMPDQQVWVANMQEYTSNMMLLVAEIHKRVRGEDPADVDQGANKGPGSAYANRRRSMGDMVADDVIRCAQGRKSIGGDVDEERAKKSQTALKALLGEDYNKVMDAMQSNGGLPPVLARAESGRNKDNMARNDSANPDDQKLNRADSNTHLIIIPNGNNAESSGQPRPPLSPSGSGNGWVSERLERSNSGRTGPGSGKVAPAPPTTQLSRLGSTELALLGNGSQRGGQRNGRDSP